MGKSILIFAGIISLLQAAVQITFASLAIAQYFCVIDFLRELPNLIFIKILYFHNPARYGSTISIGHAVDGIASQAFVLLVNEPFTSTRTFIINCTSLALGYLWATASTILLANGARNEFSRPTRWPWVAVTVAVCASDLVATVIFANDSFHTRSLSDIMKYIGGTVSGIGGTPIDTSAAAWIMVALYSRFILFFILNVVLIIIVALNKNLTNQANTQIESPEAMEDSMETTNKYNEDGSSAGSSLTIPRVTGLKKSNTFAISKTIPQNVPESSESSERLPQTSRTFKPKSVIFPQNLMSLSQRMEYIIAEQQKRLDHSVRNCPESKPIETQLPATNINSTKNGDPGTTSEQKKQKPWSYTPAPAHYMRDDLCSDEELPPIPLPDYTALGVQFRKASVHHAPSTLSLIHKKKHWARH